MANRRIRRTKSLSGYLGSVNEDVLQLNKRNNIRSVSANSIGSSEIGEDVILDNKAISSANYLPGEDGWKIDGYGNAEFANVFVRGDINAESGTIGYWNISQPLVNRTFGTTKLFGTFLESSDLGTNDDSVISGTYVSLYKSYIDEPTAITSAKRVSNIATVVATEHNYSVGDLINVTITDGDSTFTASNVAVLVTTPTGYSYTSSGSDTAANVSVTAISSDGSAVTYTAVNSFTPGEIVTITGATSTAYNLTQVPVNTTDGQTFTVLSTATGSTSTATAAVAATYVDITGSSILAIEDTAGLYLRDYTKSDFDYGYFSNRGLKYVSAEKVNLLHNPTFEYVDPTSITDGIIASSSGWSLVNPGSTITASTIDILYGTSSNTRFNAYSGYGYAVTNTGGSTPSKSSYLLGTIDYLAATNYNLFSNDRTLNFNFDLFFTQSQTPLGTKIDYANIGRLAVQGKTLTTPSATLTTSQPHGHVVGDSVTVTGVDTVVNVTNKARTLTTVTLTFASTTHKIIVGDSITVAISDANYDGTYTVATQSATTITYAKTSASTQATTAASGTITHNLFNGTYTLTGVTSNTFSYAKTHATYTFSAVTGGVAQFSTSNIYVNTQSSHGLSVGDIVYIDADLTDDVNSRDYSKDYTVLANGKTHVVTAVPSSTWFCYANTDTTNLTFGLIPTASANILSYYITGVTVSGSGPYTYTATIMGGLHPFVVGSVVDVTIFDQFDATPTWGDSSVTPKTITAVTDRSISFVSSASDYDPLYVYTGTAGWAYPNAYKTFSPSYDVSAIKIQYGSDTSATSDLYDVLTTTTQGSWASLSRRSTTAQTYMSKVLDGASIPEITATSNSNLEISAKKLLDAYTLKNPTGLASNENIYIRFPGYLDKYNITNTTSSGSVVSDSSGRNVGFIIDNIYLATSSEFFYGDSSNSGHYWYSDQTAETLGPAQASIKNAKDWLDIDLPTQTASLQFDTVSITERYFSKQLMSYASLTSTPGTEAENPFFNSGELSGVSLTSGEYEYTKASVPETPVYLKSTFSQYVGDGGSGIELFSTERTISEGVMSDPIRKSGFDVWLSVDEGEQTSQMTIYADRIALLPSDTANFSGIYDPPLALGYLSGSNDSTGDQLDTPDEFTHAVFSRNETNVTRALTTYTVYGTGSGVSTALTASSCYARFRTGQSGVSQITVFFRTVSDVAAQSALGSFVIYKYVGEAASGHPLIGGATLLSASDVRATQSAGTAAQSSSYTYLFMGTPNTSYVVAAASRSSSASATATFYSRAITVVPVM